MVCAPAVLDDVEAGPPAVVAADAVYWVAQLAAGAVVDVQEQQAVAFLASAVARQRPVVVALPQVLLAPLILVLGFAE